MSHRSPLTRRCRRLIVTVTLCAMPWLAGSASAQPPGRDLILVVDLSRSMVGAGGTPDIFGQVQNTLRQLVSDLSLGDAVTLVTFDAAVTGYPTVTLLSEAERRAVFDQIGRLKAQGQWTYTAEGLAAGLREADRLSSLRGVRGVPSTVLVLTDGLNDPPPAARRTAPSLDAVTKPYAGRPWFVYQVQLGRDVDQDLARALSVFPNARTIHDPGGVRLPELPRALAPPPPPEWVWDVDPADVGVVLERPQAAVEREVTVSATVGGRPVERFDVSLSEAAPQVGLQIAHQVTTASGTHNIRVSATASADVPDGRYAAVLRLQAGDSALPEAGVREVPIVVTVALPRPWPAWVWALLAAVALSAVASGAVLVRRRRLLFGSLDAWRPSEPARKARIDDLSTHGTRVGLGGEGGVSLPGVERPFAALQTTVHEGQRHVVARPLGAAVLTHAGRQTIELVLYDGDEFEIEGWRFRYRGEVERRRAGA